MRKLLLILLALAAVRLLPRAARQQVKAAGLMTMLGTLLAMATTPANTSKTMNLEQRTSALETRVGNLEQGMVPNLQSGSTIGRLNAGTFTGVDGGASAVQLVGNGTLRVGPLSQFVNLPNTTWLATLSQCGPQADYAGHDGFTGTAWGTNERDFVNTANSTGQAVKNALVNHGFMAP